MQIQVSHDFRRKASSAVSSIVIFIFVYFLIFIFALALAGGSVVVGIWLIAAKPMFFTLMAGAGLAGCGLLVFYFVIKFLFKKHVNDLSHLTEIKRKDEPELFKMIDEIVKEAGTDAPKRVYLSNEVNASVFYDSSFWSMFFPIKKNLTIGVGLVNVSTKQELKAILAHEFGHFSQRSMKVGSYVYNVNQIIFNLVNDDESYQNSVQKWASVSGYFSIFAVVAFFITNKIKWVLTKMYNFVNVRYMALSREMEFHADEVAAHISGSLPLEESLMRMEIADDAYGRVISFYTKKIAKNQSSKNLYQEQRFVLNFLAEQNKLEIKHGLPVVKQDDSGWYNKSKLNIENQWASHPTVADRVVRLQALNIQKEADHSPANTLFSDYHRTEERLTTKLFLNVKYDHTRRDVEFDQFTTEFTEEFRRNSFHKIFNSYYDHKNPGTAVKDDVTNLAENAEDLFSYENVEKVYTLIALENDKNTLEAILRKEIPVKTFDYDGVKYKMADAKKLIPQLENEITQLSAEIESNDQNIYSYFLKTATEAGKKEEFISTYRRFSAFDEAYTVKYKLYTDLIEATAFLNVTTPFEVIRKNFAKLKPLEDQLKKELSVILEIPEMTDDLSVQELADLKHFVEFSQSYFGKDQYHTVALQRLVQAINLFPYFLNLQYFKQKKEVLDLMNQLEEWKLEDVSDAMLSGK
ncbi:hypothetical protein ASG01_13445 [Chryseobacterium sp. Leaf180]|uniref:M48 family metalloprotease n=1 Tax=Chryseobacterium sp. Leaf180 TaxID=1736289 RepID=UPI0006F3D113|nr:M48 family metallopeptidase [Chryseobacterium sp. Leaf180]KQR91997.1 hypothetical protein ASG01_13445 [Chryseobacterium sp. Leaf180]